MSPAANKQVYVPSFLLTYLVAYLRRKAELVLWGNDTRLVVREPRSIK